VAFIQLHRVYERRYKSTTNEWKWFKVFNFLALITGTLENLSLYMLTFVSSKENYKTHENSFIGFILFSHLYFLIFLPCYRFATSPNNLAYFRTRVFLAALQSTCILTGAYTFVRHKRYCEPGMYSLFALCEWLYVASNIIFHIAQWWELEGIYVTLTKQNYNKLS